MERHKLSASALATYLKSPKSFYWRYRAGLEPLQQQVANWDHDKLFGILWAEFVDRFYRGVAEVDNTAETLKAWLEQTDGWVPTKAQERLTKALETLMPQYYQSFSPDDGARCQGQSELYVENERFQGYLDGFCNGVVHEVKSTSRCPQLNEQLWKVQNSVQVKLYCVLTEATGVLVEFAFKDPPHQVYRSQVLDVSEVQRRHWENELNTLADHIYSLGDNPDHYVCNSDGCSITSKNMASMCQYYPLCSDGLNEVTQIAYKPRTRR